MSIKEKATQLGWELANSLEYKEMQEKQRLIMADEQASAMVKDYEDKARSYYNAQAKGIQIAGDQNNLLKELEQKMMSNPLVHDYSEARERFNSMMKEVNDKISEGIGMKK